MREIKIDFEVREGLTGMEVVFFEKLGVRHLEKGVQNF